MPLNFGAFAGGLAQGLQQGQQLAVQRQEAQLRSKMLDAQMKHLDFQNQQLVNTVQQHQQAQQMASEAANAYGASVTGGQPAQPGFEDEAAQMSRAPVPAQMGPTPMTPQQQFIKSGLQQGKFTAGMAHLLGPGQGQPSHVVGNKLISGAGDVLYSGEATPYQQAEEERKNRALDIQSANVAATREATAAQRAHTNALGDQAASDRQQRIKDAQQRTALMDEDRKATLYQQALKAKASTDPGPVRRIAEALGWPAPSTREEQNALVESLRPGQRTQPPGTPAAGGAITAQEAVQFLQQAGGDKEKARALARQAGKAF